MSDDNTGSATRDALLEAKLELIRQAMSSGFASMERALKSHVDEDAEAYRKVDVLEERVRQVELDAARESTKLKLFMAMMGIGSSGLGAALGKFVF